MAPILTYTPIPSGEPPGYIHSRKWRNNQGATGDSPRDSQDRLPKVNGFSRVRRQGRRLRCRCDRDVALRRPLKTRSLSGSRRPTGPSRGLSPVAPGYWHYSEFGWDGCHYLVVQLQRDPGLRGDDWEVRRFRRGRAAGGAGMTGLKEGMKKYRGRGLLFKLMRR